jgi:hypothetical protein
MRFNSIPVKKAGGVNWLIILAVAALGALALVFVMSGDTPQTVANRFMTALAKGDVDTLVELSEASGKTDEELRQDWEFAVKRAGPHYRFRWHVLSSKEADAQTSAVSMWLWRNAMSSGSYEEKYAIPLTKVDGKWKVLVRELNREIYPGLPR